MVWLLLLVLVFAECEHMFVWVRLFVERVNAICWSDSGCCVARLISQRLERWIPFQRDKGRGVISNEIWSQTCWMLKRDWFGCTKEKQFLSLFFGQKPIGMGHHIPKKRACVRVVQSNSTYHLCALSRITFPIRLHFVVIFSIN